MSVLTPLWSVFKSRELKPEIREEDNKAKYDRVRELREVVRRGNTLRGLQGHGSWPSFEEGITARLNGLYARLASCKPTDLKLLQAQISELKFVLGIIPKAMEEGAQAEAELNGLED